MEKHLKNTIARKQGDQKQLDNFFKSNGKSVEELYTNNWRVARLPLSAFPVGKFKRHGQGDDPLDSGHIEIIGSQEDFELYGAQIASQSTLCSREECR